MMPPKQLVALKPEAAIIKACIVQVFVGLSREAKNLAALVFSLRWNMWFESSHHLKKKTIVNHWLETDCNKRRSTNIQWWLIVVAVAVRISVPRFMPFISILVFHSCFCTRDNADDNSSMSSTSQHIKRNVYKGKGDNSVCTVVSVVSIQTMFRVFLAFASLSETSTMPKSRSCDPKRWIEGKQWQGSAGWVVGDVRASWCRLWCQPWCPSGILMFILIVDIFWSHDLDNRLTFLLDICIHKLEKVKKQRLLTTLLVFFMILCENRSKLHQP